MQLIMYRCICSLPLSILQAIFKGLIKEMQGIVYSDTNVIQMRLCPCTTLKIADVLAHDGVPENANQLTS